MAPQRQRGTVRRSFQERTNAASKGEKLEWEPDSHLIKNLCLLSPDSRNGRTYTPEAMQDAVRMYDGARAYANHPDDPRDHRKLEERLGRWHNPRIVNGQVRADLHYNPAHPYAQSLIWAVQNAPDHCGVSHNVEAEGYEGEDGHFTVTKLAEVRSVDIVDDPATNRSLLESTQPKKRRRAREANMDPELDDGMGDDGEGWEAHLGRLISGVCNDPNMDKAGKRKKVLKALDLYDEPEAGGEVEEDEGELAHDRDDDEKPQEPEGEDQFEEDDDEDKEEEGGPMMARESYDALRKLAKNPNKAVRALAEQALRGVKPPTPVRKPVKEDFSTYTRHADPIVRQMAKRLDALEAEKVSAEAVRRAVAECKKYNLPPRVTTRLLIEQLADEPDARRRKAMIMEYAHLASVQLPRSVAPMGSNGHPRMSNADFANLVEGD